MDIKNLRESEAVVEKIEEALQSAYSSNQEFNDTLDEVEPVSFKSRRDQEHEYRYNVSDVLYWVDRDAYLDELDYWNDQRKRQLHKNAIDFLKSSDQSSVFLDLVDAMRNGRVAPFVGAGLSCPCGYPTWSETLRKIAKRLEELGVSSIEQHLAKFEYLEAAQVLYDAGPEQVRHFIKTEFRQRTTPASGPVLLLPELAKGCIITTNFDTVIEDLLQDREQGVNGYMYGTQPGNAFVERLMRGDRCLLKLHGDARQDNTYVFTRAQYTDAYGEPVLFQKQLPRALRQIFISHSLIFLGCSMEQDKTLDLFKSVVQEQAFDIPEHFALLSGAATAKERVEKEDRLLKLKIKPIWYEIPTRDGVPDHSLLEQLLKLAIAVASREVVLE